VTEAKGKGGGKGKVRGGGKEVRGGEEGRLVLNINPVWYEKYQ